MRYQVEYSQIALRDLDQVWYEVFEASKDYGTAQKYLDELINKIEQKSDFPKSGIPLYYEDLFEGYYFVSFKSYLAFYRIEGDRMLVERVLYSASDYRRFLPGVSK
ncbi:MAG: type II toxin-antitoxin system RelE/ParE family toxin [Lactimicrobium sp.]|jgi:toxin ParE1/3/4|uniref:type II toxin-antitoxin system RelE/ParE family toxin n=1 Tax=Lactimicrobium sp. TaxID=2563780 RepID=UPI002F354E89